MASFMMQVAYTPEMVKAAIENPRDRTQHVNQVIENLGGTLHGMWFCIGDYDVVAIYDLPDNEAAVAFSLAVAGGGAVKNLRTTTLLSEAEAISGFYKAQKCGYAPMKIEKKTDK